MMCENMIILLMATCLHPTSATQSAIQVILGGLWFSKISVGTSGSYMLSEWREKIFNQLMSRVAQKVMENMIRLNELQFLRSRSRDQDFSY